MLNQPINQLRIINFIEDKSDESLGCTKIDNHLHIFALLCIFSEAATRFYPFVEDGVSSISATFLCFHRAKFVSTGAVSWSSCIEAPSILSKENSHTGPIFLR